MHLSTWPQLFNIAACLFRAYTQAAQDGSLNQPEYDGRFGEASGEKVLAGLCPDYTTYARHFQYASSSLHYSSN